MTQTIVPRTALIGLVVLLTGCGGSGPASPTPSTDVRPALAPAPPAVPQPSGPSRVFAFDRQLSYAVSEYTKRSRLDLYDNGAFVLEFPVCSCPGAYRGTYTEANGIITFMWEGWSIAGPWGATASLEGDMLAVRYNPIMQLSDFEDAVYRRIG